LTIASYIACTNNHIRPPGLSNQTEFPKLKEGFPNSALSLNHLF